jgi:hypothetical protein
VDVAFSDLARETTQLRADVDAALDCSAIERAGAVPVPCDVQPTATLEPESLARVRTEKTRAIVPVHL